MENIAFSISTIFSKFWKLNFQKRLTKTWIIGFLRESVIVQCDVLHTFFSGLSKTFKRNYRLWNLTEILERMSWMQVFCVFLWFTFYRWWCGKHRFFLFPLFSYKSLEESAFGSLRVSCGRKHSAAYNFFKIFQIFATKRYRKFKFSISPISRYIIKLSKFLEKSSKSNRE